MSVPFEPRVALASLSGAADAQWARQAADHAGAAFLGGIALDDPTREAARALVARDREEFLPADPLAFVDEQLGALADAPIRAGFNVRAAGPEPVAAAASVCADHDAILEINAHCRQDEMCAAGAGESLLRDTDRLRAQVAAAAEDAGADVLHVDAMDTEAVIADVADASDCFLVANNEVRDRASVREYLGHGADAVSVGRASDDPAVMQTVREATDEWVIERRVEGQR